MNNKGLTLTEIIIAVLIIVIASTGLLGAFFGGQQLMDRSWHRMQALNFAIEAHEKLRASHNYNDPEMSVLDGHPESNIGTVLKGDLTDLSAALTYDVKAEPEPASYKEVVINVSWDERSFE